METLTDETKPPQPPGTESHTRAKPRSKPVTPPQPAEPAGAPLLGADGKELEPEFSEGPLYGLCTPLMRFTERNPKGAALLSLGVGFIAGAIVGMLVRRD